MKKNISKILLIFLIPVILFSCRNEDAFTASIFDTTDTLNVNSATYQFDLWLRNSYLIPYNMDFRYKMQDVG